MDFPQIPWIHLKIPQSSLSESHVSLSIIFINKTVKTCEGLIFYMLGNPASFMDAGRRYVSLESETKGFIFI